MKRSYLNRNKWKMYSFFFKQRRLFSVSRSLNRNELVCIETSETVTDTQKLYYVVFALRISICCSFFFQMKLFVCVSVCVFFQLFCLTSQLHIRRSDSQSTTRIIKSPKIYIYNRTAHPPNNWLWCWLYCYMKFIHIHTHSWHRQCENGNVDERYIHAVSVRISGEYIFVGIFIRDETLFNILFN